ncbi:MAG: hypothetical protein ACPL1B_06865 [Thermoprotei archaeon]
MKKKKLLLGLALILITKSATADPMEEIQKLQKEIFQMKIQQERLQQKIQNLQLKSQLMSTTSSMSLTEMMNKTQKIQQEIALLQAKIELEKVKLREAKELGQALMIQMPYKGTAMNKYVITNNGVIEAGSDFGLGSVNIKQGVVKAGPYYITNEQITQGGSPASSNPMMGGRPMMGGPMGGMMPVNTAPPSSAPPSLPPLPPLAELLGNSPTPPPSTPTPPPPSPSGPMQSPPMPPGVTPPSTQQPTPPHP